MSDQRLVLIQDTSQWLRNFLVKVLLSIKDITAVVLSSCAHFIRHIGEACMFTWISEYNLLTCFCVALGVIVQREIHDWIKTFASSIIEHASCIWSVTALPLVNWLPPRWGLSARQRHQSAITHWSMEWTTGYTIALFPVLLCMELCVHGGEDCLFLDILCLQQAPHITMTTKYLLYWWTVVILVFRKGYGNLCTTFRPSVFINLTFLYPQW